MAGIIGLLLVCWLVKSIPPKLKDIEDEPDYIYYFDDIYFSSNRNKEDAEKNCKMIDIYEHIDFEEGDFDS